MPLINYHSARQREPSEFLEQGMGESGTFAKIAVTKGVTAIAGKLKNPPKNSDKDATHIQEYLFDTSVFTEEQAKAWLKTHKAKTGKFEPAKAEADKTESAVGDISVLNEKTVDATSDTDILSMFSDEGESEDKDEAALKGSYEELKSKLDTAVNANPSSFGGSGTNIWFSIYATFPKEVIVSRYGGGIDEPTRYYQAGYKQDDKGNISFSDVKEVVFDVKVKPKTEQVITDMGIFNESFILSTSDGTLLLEEVRDPNTGAVTVKGKVPVAQKANSRNRNQRVYLPEALKEAVEDAKTRLPLLMEAEHRVDDAGHNKRDLEKTVAVIHEIEWHPDTQTVSLSDIRFVETQSGKNITAVLRGGAKLQTSQRGTGKSEVAKWTDGKVAEIVTQVRFDGYDFTPPNEASVTEADFQMAEAKKEGDFEAMLNSQIITKDETKKLIEEMGAQIKDSLTTVIKETLGAKTDPPKDEQVPPKEQVPPAEATPVTDPKILEKVSAIEAKMTKDSATLDEITRERELTLLGAKGADIVKGLLATEEFNRFNANEKLVIQGAVDPKSLYGHVGIDDTVKLTEALTSLVKNEASKFDQIIAAVKLRNSGFPDGIATQDSGRTVQVIHENSPGAAFIAKMTEDIDRRLKKDNPNEFILPNDHIAQKAVREIMDKYYEENAKTLKKLDESGEQVYQVDIGVRAATIAAVAIPAAMRRLTALQVVDVGTQTARIEDIPIKAWLPAETSGRIDTDMAAVEILDAATVATAGVTYSNYPAYAMRKALRTFISPDAYATAKGTGLDPEADAISGLVDDIRHRIDRLLWLLMITKAQAYSTSQQTSFTAMTHLGSNVWGVQSSGSTLRGWVKFEWVKTYDANGNPTGAKLIPLFGTTSGNTLQKVQVQEAAGDNTDLVYSDDYKIDWASGTIQLTAAGIVKEASNGLQVKYTRTTNLSTFSRTPDAGVTLYDHISNLRQAITDAKVAISNRHYDPSFVSMSLEVEALITNGKTFSELGRTPADTLDQLNNVINYAGLTPYKTSAMPYTWALVGQNGGAFYKVQTPWGLTGPVVDKDTGDKYWLAQEYSSTDVPKAEKFSLVAITDLNQFE